MGKQAALWEGRVIAWFSNGAASTIAAKLALQQRPDTLVINHDLSESEHPDNARFFGDVQRWLGVKIMQTRHPAYGGSVDKVFSAVRYLRGVHGAPCTKKLKRDMGDIVSDFQDINVFGFTADEQSRIEDFERRDPNIKNWWVLRDAGITKADCFRMLAEAGIELPAMYRLGYRNNNCIGCVKGGMGYWNKIRRDFPEVFARRAAQEREIGASVIKGVFLDELAPDRGRYESEPGISCGPVCSME